MLEILITDRVMFSGNSLSAKKLYLLYNVNSRHYNVITNIRPEMSKRYTCNDVTHYKTINTNATNFAPCVQLRHPVLKKGSSIVVRATGGFSVRNIFRIIYSSE